MKYKAGSVIKTFTLKTVKGDSVTIPDPEAQFTHLQFRLWAGSAVCSTHLSYYRKSNKRIKEAGIKEIIFFYSDPADLPKWLTDYPIDIVCDPAKVIYNNFGVESSMSSMFNMSAIKAGINGIGLHQFNFKSKNGMSGLPADFLIAPNGKVVSCRYGTHAYDQWAVNEMLHLVKAFEGKMGNRAGDDPLYVTPIVAEDVIEPVTVGAGGVYSPNA